MRCETHCPPGDSGMAGAVAAVLMVVAAGAVVSVAYAVLASAAEALGITVGVACALGAVFTVRFIGGSRAGFGVVVPRRVTVQAELVRGPYKIPAPPLMIEAPRVVPAALARDDAKVEA